MEITLALIVTALSRHSNGLANTISVNSALDNRGLNSIMCCENLWSEQDNKVLIAGILPLNRKLIVLVPSIGNFLQRWGIWLFCKNASFWKSKVLNIIDIFYRHSQHVKLVCASFCFLSLINHMLRMPCILNRVLRLRVCLPSLLVLTFKAIESNTLLKNCNGLMQHQYSYAYVKYSAEYGMWRSASK